jgi:hypothetical protein
MLWCSQYWKKSGVAGLKRCWGMGREIPCCKIRLEPNQAELGFMKIVLAAQLEGLGYKSGGWRLMFIQVTQDDIWY